MNSEKYDTYGAGAIVTKWTALLLVLVITTNLFMSWFGDGLSRYTDNLVLDIIGQAKTGP